MGAETKVAVRTGGIGETAEEGEAGMEATEIVPEVVEMRREEEQETASEVAEMIQGEDKETVGEVEKTGNVQSVALTTLPLGLLANGAVNLVATEGAVMTTEDEEAEVEGG